jgi:hypothetical protein
MTAELLRDIAVACMVGGAFLIGVYVGAQAAPQRRYL